MGGTRGNTADSAGSGVGVAERVRALRLRRNASQYRVAIDARVHPATISALERGIRVSPETLARIAGALGTTVEALRS